MFKPANKKTALKSGLFVFLLTIMKFIHGWLPVVDKEVVAIMEQISYVRKRLNFQATNLSGE